MRDHDGVEVTALGLRAAQRLRPGDVAGAKGWASVRGRSGPIGVQVMVSRGEPAGGSISQVRVGFAAGKALGNAVVRNRVRRCLREAVRPMVPVMQVAAMGRETLVIVRAGPGTAELTTPQLRGHLNNALDGLVARVAERAGSTMVRA